MLKTFLSFLFLIITNCLFSQVVKKGCVDTSYNFQLKANQRFSIQDQKILVNGDNISCGFIKANSIVTAPIDGWLLLTDKKGNIKWSKEIHHSDSVNILFTNVLELKDGSFIVNGKAYDNKNTYNEEDLFVAKFDVNGVLLWQHRYKTLPIAVGQNFPRQITEDKDGNIFFTTDNGHDYSIITKLNLNGLIVWSKGFGNRLLYGSTFSLNGVFFKDSLLYSIAINYNEYGVVEMNKYSGQYHWLKIYSIVQQGFFTPFVFTAFPIHARKLANGHYLVCAQSNTGSGSDFAIGAQYQVVEFDTTFSAVKSYLLKAFPFVNTVRDIAIKENGDLAYYFTKGTNRYYGIIENDGQVKRQNKLIANNVNFNPSLTSSVIAIDNNSQLMLSQIYNSGSGTTTLERHAIDESNTYNICLQEIDTAFTTTENFTLATANAAFDRIDNNVLTEQIFPVTLQDVPFTKNEICKSVSICDSLKITGPDSICIFQSPVQFSAYKSATCLKSLSWQIDSSAIRSIIPVNDSTISIDFNKPWQGYLHTGLVGCSLKDSIRVNVYDKISKQILAPDTSFCSGDSLLLTAAGNYQSYIWNTGATTNSITVKSNGVYTVTALLSNGCSVTDTTTIFPLHLSPRFTLAKSNQLCFQQNDTLTPGNNYLSYVWQDGSRRPTFIVNQPGKYWVNVSDSFGCTGADTAFIQSISLPPSNFIISDTLICSYQTISLFPNRIFTHYLWSTGSPSPSIEVNKKGIYALKVIDEKGCTGKEQVTVDTKECKNILLFPSAFSPNDDGKNDLFKPFVQGDLKLYELRIYNRWGQLVFKTKSAIEGWSGQINTQFQPNGLFVYTVKYRFQGEFETIQKGTIVVIK